MPDAIRLRAIVAGLCVAALLPVRLEAALVVLDDGRTLKATSFELQGERISIGLPGGGWLSLDLDRIERILDDEIEPEPALVAASPAPAAPKRSVRTPGPAGPAGPVTYRNLILAAAREHRLDPALLSAVIRVESNFSPRAVSPKGARGLMQLMPATARQLGVARPFDPGENIRGGAAYLSMLAERFGETEVELILAAYNAGERAVETWGGLPPYRETRDYVKKVAGAWNAAR